MQGDIKMSKLASCGGCGAKVGAGMLSQILQGIPTVKDENLLVGYDTSDDAAVYKVSDDLAIVQTLDFFPPIVDDPYMFGQIAAANAISDIYAMGATPKIALNIMTVTPQMSKEMIHEVLRGGYTKAAEADALAFEDAYMRRYFEVCRRLVKEVDPKLLYLGCSFSMSGREWEKACRISSEYCDVISCNTYRYLSLIHI